MENNPKLNAERHVKYLLRCLNVLPSSCASVDTSRLSVGFFGISGTDILKRREVLDRDVSKIVNWIYSLQIIPNPTDDENDRRCGFRGSLYATRSLGLSTESDNSSGSPSSHILDTSHIAMTYAALCSLLVLGDDLSRVNRPGILKGVQALQLPNGSFCATLEGSEDDVRFVYCAACICYLLNDWSHMNVEAATRYITSCISYDGAIGQGPGQEGHAGLTFCGIAALSLMGTLETAISSQQRRKLTRWLLMRQVSGFQGRPNKPVDTCYTFWVSASLKLLDADIFINKKANRDFILAAQCLITGGLSKWVDYASDPLHTYLGLSGLSIGGEDELAEVHPALNISMRAYEHWRKLVG